ncbi:MAG: hypothetical protein OHK93_005312 [Ramalina farinacea]|uniref:Uncharacterized protein n=1 Tax=Ramalina farinacea TaxID=258253 RepID=A0AA43QWE1_9LECA|nr:hypothetical protein [Ramalina farinacea]
MILDQNQEAMLFEDQASKEERVTQIPMGPTMVAPPPLRPMTLPSELRLEIYDIYFATRSYNGDPEIPQRFRDPTAKTETGLIRSLVDRLEVQSDDFDSRRDTSNLNLLVVSKLIHAEAIPRFYHHHLFSLPTYCSPVSGSGWTGLNFEPPVLRLEQTRHFDLIRRLELVHQHLGDVVADRQHTDRAISSLLNMLNQKCPSLRYLSIRVICDMRTERTLFCALRRARRVEYPYLDFRRQTPLALQSLLPRLDRLEIHMVDSETDGGCRLCGRQPVLLTWAWYWRRATEEQKAAKVGRSSRSHFFYNRSAEISPEDMKRGFDEDIIYSLASMEPFAHFVKPGVDRGYLDKYVRGGRRPIFP